MQKTHYTLCASVYLIIAACALGCATQTTRPLVNPTMDNPALSSAVSARINFNPSTQATLALPKDVDLIIDPRLSAASSEVMAIQKLLPFVRTRLLHELGAQKNFIFAGIAASDYLVDATVMFGNGFNENDLIREYGIAPQLTVSESAERSTLIVLIRNLRGQVLWRGAVQLTSTPDLEQDTVKQRVAASVASLVSQIPRPR